MKKIIISIIVILLLVGGGFFWWWQGREIKGSPKDYVIKETTEGKFVENKKAGLKVKVPEGWEVKKMEIKEGSVVIHTSDIEGKQQNGMIVPPLTKGCGIDTSVIYGDKELSLEEIENKVKALHWAFTIKFDGFEEINVKGYPALKNIIDTEELGSTIAVYIPKENRIYSLGLYLSPDEKEKEKCIQEFNKFLETVSIK